MRSSEKVTGRTITLHPLVQKVTVGVEQIPV